MYVCLCSILCNQVRGLGRVPGSVCMRSKNMPAYWGTQCRALWRGMRGDNGESPSRVGSWKVRGTERGENIQFNFETAPAQSTNTKASLQADPRWRLELIHRLQARGERTAWEGRRGGARLEGATRSLVRERGEVTSGGEKRGRMKERPSSS